MSVAMVGPIALRARLAVGVLRAIAVPLFLREVAAGEAARGVDPLLRVEIPELDRVVVADEPLPIGVPEASRPSSFRRGETQTWRLFVAPSGGLSPHNTSIKRAI